MQLYFYRVQTFAMRIKCPPPPPQPHSQLRPPDRSQNYEGVSAVIAGWGATQFQGSPSDVLRVAR